MSELKKKRINHRHYVVAGIFVLMALWSFFICKNSYIRVFYSVIDLAKSFVYGFFFNFEWAPIPDINELRGVDVVSLFPQTVADFSSIAGRFFERFFTLDNFLEWILTVIPTLLFISQTLMILSLFAAGFVIFKLFKKPSINNDYGKETKALKRYKRFCAGVVTPIYDYLKSVYIFVLEHKLYKFLICFVFLLSTNILSVLISALAYYFYILGSMNFSSFFFQLYKLSVDLIIMLSTLPALVWFFIAVLVFDKITKHFAFSRLDVQISKDEFVVRQFGIVVFVTGVMRSGKTMLLTAFQTIKARIFRKDSKKTLLDIHMSFPYFPYAVFQQELLRLFKKDKNDKLRVNAAANLKLYLDYKESKFSKKPCADNIFGYDFERYGMYFDNGNKLEFLWDKLYSYGRAFLVYTEPCYFISNYSVRELQTSKDVGNLPNYSFEIVRLPSFNGAGMYSHKIDFDMIRPGKKHHPENNTFGTLEHFILGIAEADKEMPNTLVTMEMKSSSEDCNPKNDFHSQFFKMQGHAGMIEYKCYNATFFDAQRAMSLEADVRGLADWICITSTSEDRLALRFFLWRDMLGDFCESLHHSKTFNHWYHKGNTTLPIYILWQITTLFANYRKRIWNRFGYRIKTLVRKNGEDAADEAIFKFYDLNMLTRVDMYATDSHSRYWQKQNLKSGRALDDIERFDSIEPSFEESVELNSYMIKTWLEQLQSNSKKKGER